ncbi:MAG: FtsX-like permease family protein, partial [Nocardioidaceae bacterium]
GVVIDYTMFSRENAIPATRVDVSILARSDTPAAIVNGLADHGITAHTSLAATRHLLDQDGYALALNLYLVVTILVIVLALCGLGTNLAVQMNSRRMDAASLRVVGLRRRSIIGAVLVEFAVVMGTAAVAGIIAGSVSQHVVVENLTLGYAARANVPRVLPSLDVTSILVLLGAVTAFLLATAVGVASLTVKGARTSTLRDSTR